MYNFRGTILLIDNSDGQGIRLIDALSDRYRSRGYNVKLVDNLSKAFEFLKKGGIVVVITDYTLRSADQRQKENASSSRLSYDFTNGYDLLRYVSKIKPEVEGILYTTDKRIGSTSELMQPQNVTLVPKTESHQILFEELDSKLAKYELLFQKAVGKGRGKNVLITGGTGFVGDLLIKKYLERTDCTLWVMSRPKQSLTAEDRILNRIEAQYHNRIKILEGDLGCRFDENGSDISAYMGLDDKNNMENYDKFLEMIEVVDEVFHNGSYLGLKKSVAERQKCMDINLLGTQRLLNLIGLFKKGLKALFYTSTAFVHGVMSEPQEFYEDEAQPKKWLNPYEESKWRAEILIKNSGYPFRIFRPGVIAKEFYTTVISTHTIYGVANVIESGYKTFKKKNPKEPAQIVLEGDADSAHNILLRADLVDMIFDIRNSSHELNHVYNTVNTHNTLLSDVLYAILYNLKPGIKYEFVADIPKDYQKNPIEEFINKFVTPIYESYLFKTSPIHRMDNVIAALGKDYLESNITKIDRALMIKLIKDHYMIKNSI